MPQKKYNTAPGQLYRSPKIFSKCKRKTSKPRKSIIKQEIEKAIIPIALDEARPDHKNIHITPLRATYKIDPKKLKDSGEKGPEELVIDQDYSIIKKRVKTFASGKIKITYVKSNPPGKRYYPRSESKIAKGDSIGDYGTVTGTTFADYQSKIKARKKEAEEESWRKK